jgi:hypothetical protein
MSPLLRHCLIALPLSIGSAYATEPSGYLGKADCRIATLTPAPTRAGVAWSGACKDGYAEGKGVLEWQTRDEGKRRLEAVLVRGEVAGEGSLAYRDGSYTGSFRQGLPHGAGYVAYSKGEGQYEGGWADGLREGRGTHIDADGSSYEGEWKAGLRHGRGKAVFTLGGNYEGEWRDDVFHGQGRIVYGGSGRSWAGEFRNGRAADAAPAPAAIGEPTRGTHTTGYVPVAVHVRRDRLLGTIPLDREWPALTPAQQSIVRDGYPALDDRDEPPYPLKGMKALYAAATDVYARFTQYEGNVIVYVTVGADGVPRSATTYHTPHPELGRFVAMAMMMQRFKPGMCAGTPCQSLYPVKFSFTLED